MRRRFDVLAVLAFPGRCLLTVLVLDIVRVFKPLACRGSKTGSTFFVMMAKVWKVQRFSQKLSLELLAQVKACRLVPI